MAVTAQVGSREYAGRTKKSLNEQIRADLAGLLDGDGFVPYMFRAKNCMLFVWRDEYGWNSKALDVLDVLDGPNEVSLSFRASYSNRGPGRNQAIAAGLAHLAQCTYGHGDSVPDWLPPDVRADHASWIDFQERYRHAREQMGMGDVDAHSYAGRNPARYDLWGSGPSRLRQGQEMASVAE